jgi:hypothetical protein
MAEISKCSFIIPGRKGIGIRNDALAVVCGIMAAWCYTSGLVKVRLRRSEAGWYWELEVDVDNMDAYALVMFWAGLIVAGRIYAFGQDVPMEMHGVFMGAAEARLDDYGRTSTLRLVRRLLDAGELKMADFFAELGAQLAAEDRGDE